MKLASLFTALGLVGFATLVAPSAEAYPLKAIQEEDKSVGISVIVPFEDDQETAVQINGEFTFARINDALTLSAAPFYNTEHEIGGTLDLKYEATEKLRLRAGAGGVVTLDEGPGAFTNSDTDSSFLIKTGASYDFSETTGVYGDIYIPTETDTVAGSFGMKFNF